MKTKLYIAAAVVLVALVALCGGLLRKVKQLETERDRYKGNTTALLSDMKRMQIDSTTYAVDLHTLRLNIDEYKRFRADDAELIKKLNIRIKSLETAARHQLAVDAPIRAEVTDTVVIRDTVPLRIQKIEMNTPHLQVSGIIENNLLTGRIQLPVTLNQFVWIEHKHRFLWWRWGVKAVHQTITADNPYVQITYSEMIQIQK